jgi:hypothetical protein
MNRIGGVQGENKEQAARFDLLEGTAMNRKKKERIWTRQSLAYLSHVYGSSPLRRPVQEKEALGLCSVSVPGGVFVWVAGETACPMRLES